MLLSKNKQIKAYNAVDYSKHEHKQMRGKKMQKRKCVLIIFAGQV